MARIMGAAADIIPQSTKDELFGNMGQNGLFINNLQKDAYSIVQIKEHPVLTQEFILANQDRLL